MAGAFSGHLLESYNGQKSFGSEGPTLMTSGAMSFNPQMHGTPSMRSFSMGDNSFAFNTSMPMFSPQLSEETTLKIAQLQAKLNQKLGPEFISQRPGPGGGPKLTYAEGWKIINLANEVFGFNGWSSSIVNLTTDFVDFNEETRRYNVGTTAIVRVTLRDGVFHEDVGYGMLENSKSKGGALDKCKKEAVTDGLKRALRNFGNLLGNCLYDKSYTQEVVKIKVPPAKFEKGELYRRPEFEEKKPDVSMLSNCIPFANASTSNINMHANATPSKPPQQPAPPNQQRPSGAAASKAPAPVPKPAQSDLNAAGNAAGPSTRPSNAGPINVGKDTRQTMQNTTKQAAINSHSGDAANRVPAVSGGSKPSKPQLVAAKAEIGDALPDDVEESFHFYSDDDAFLANVDMGEGDLVADLGRLIDDEDDMGRPIDHSEGLGGNASALSDTSVQDNSKHSRPQDSNNSNGGVPSRPPAQRRSESLQQQIARSLSTDPAPPSRPSGNAALTSNVPATPTGRPNASGSHAAGGLGGSNATRTPFAPPNAQGSSSTSSSSMQHQRPTTPSMGGFNFPPGMDAKQLNQQGRPPVPQNHLRTTSTIGQKRPSDAMSVSSGLAYKGAGMGLASRSTNIGSGQRQPLGPLEVNEGGDVKRMRR